MTTKPTDHPEINSQSLGPEVAPTPTQRTTGWTASTRPSRQLFHFLWRKTQEWTKYLESGVHRRSDIAPDHFIPVANAWGGTVKVLPALTSGTLTGVTGARTGLISGDKAEAADAAHVFSANSDTYFDLQRAGGWSITVVASGAGAPAVAANTLRSHRVRTDGTEITEVEDLGDDTYGDRAVIDQPAAYSHSLELGRDKQGSDALAALANLVHQVRLPVSGAFSLIERVGSSVLPNFRRYHYNDSATQQSHYWVMNASFDGTIWTRDTALQDSYLLRLYDGGLKLYRHPASGSATWANTLSGAGAWEDLFDIAGNGIATMFDDLIAVGNVDAGGTIAATGNVTGDDFIAAGQVSGTHFVPSTNPGGVPDAHGLYRGNVPKAWGVCVTAGGGAFSVAQGFGIASFAFAGSNIEIILDRAMVDTNYTVVAMGATVDKIVSGNPTSTTRILLGQNSPGAAVDNLSTIAGQRIHFVVFGDQ